MHGHGLLLVVLESTDVAIDLPTPDLSVEVQHMDSAECPCVEQCVEQCGSALLLESPNRCLKLLQCLYIQPARLI